jgi:hypothetical protein
MIYQTESKFQGWRAIAIAEDRTEHLVFLGRSSTQVRTGYAAAYHEILVDPIDLLAYVIHRYCTSSPLKFLLTGMVFWLTGMVFWGARAG